VHHAKAKEDHKPSPCRIEWRQSTSRINSAMSAKALRLTLRECHIQQTGNRRDRISRLQQNEQQRPPEPQSESDPSNASVATGVPNVELAALIASIVD